MIRTYVSRIRMKECAKTGSLKLDVKSDDYDEFGSARKSVIYLCLRKVTKVKRIACGRWSFRSFAAIRFGYGSTRILARSML